MLERLSRASARLSGNVHGALSNTCGIGFSDFVLLRAIHDTPGSRRVDLAARVGLTASGVTRALLPLEKLGIVERVRDPRDARASRARLTPAGETLLRDATVIASEATASALANRLDIAARADLLSLVERLG